MGLTKGSTHGERRLVEPVEALLLDQLDEAVAARDKAEGVLGNLTGKRRDAEAAEAAQRLRVSTLEARARALRSSFEVLHAALDGVRKGSPAMGFDNDLSSDDDALEFDSSLRQKIDETMQSLGGLPDAVSEHVDDEADYKRVKAALEGRWKSTSDGVDEEQARINEQLDRAGFVDNRTDREVQMAQKGEARET